MPPRLVLALALGLAGCETTFPEGERAINNPHCLAFCRTGGETLRDKLTAVVKQCPRAGVADN
jgi:hypothetical protein